MVDLNQNWLEQKDIRNVKFDDQDWIPIYGFKYGAERLRFPQIGHYEEFQEFRGAVIYEENQLPAEGITSWNTWSDDDVCEYDSDDYPYPYSHQFNNLNDPPIGFRLVVSQFLSNDSPARVHLHQDFIITYNLIFDGKGWIRPKKHNEQVVRYIFYQNSEVMRVEVKARLLKDYLSIRGAIYRMYYYSGRRFVQKDKPNFDWEEEKTISSLPNDRCTANIEYTDFRGERISASSTISETANNSKNTKEETPNASNNIVPHVGSGGAITGDVSASNRYFAYCRMWRGEWVWPDDTPVNWNVSKQQGNALDIRSDAGESLKQGVSNSAETIPHRWFQPKAIRDHLLERNARLDWRDASSGTLHYGNHSQVAFELTEDGLIIVPAKDIARLSRREIRKWISHACEPDELKRGQHRMSRHMLEQAHTGIPEKNLTLAIEQVNQSFLQRFCVPLLLPGDEMHNIISKIHRFRAVDEDGLLALARDMTKYVLEWISPSNLHSVVKFDVSKRKTLKMLKHFLQVENGVDNADEIMAPLFGLYGLRNYDSHLPSSCQSVEVQYTKVGVNRDQPTVHQGAEMIQKVAGTLSKFIG